MLTKLKVSMVIVILVVAIFPITTFAVVNGTTSPGWCIFDWCAAGGTFNYRYGPSIIINDDNSIDAWFASPGGNGQWDWIRYRHSNDNGQTWTNETVVLTPTSGSADNYSCCDPGVIKFGGYYYIGYTSTTDSRGCNNQLFVARSTSPTGPFDKWNGSGWGGNPQPFITYNGPTDAGGVGEPSFVAKDNTLYIYYSWISRDATDHPLEQTRVATASVTDVNWPANTSYQGVAINRNMTYIEDSADVKYIDAYGKFFAINTRKRMTTDAFINAYESTDGITFTPANLPKNFIVAGCHNCGLSGNALGHIDLTKNNFIAYAYGFNTWAQWNTYLNPITFSNDDLPAVPEIYSYSENNGQVTLYFETVPGVSYKIKYGTSSGSYSNTITGITSSPYTVTGLANGTTYYFAIAASNSKGDSSNSLQISAIPLNYTISPRVSATASSQLTGWDASYAIDSDIATTWSSYPHTSGNNVEWIYVDTGSNRAIKRVTLTPRQNNECCFGDVKVQVSVDAINWVDADYDLNYNTIFTTYKYYVANFIRPIYGRYVRIWSNVLTPDSYGNYYFQIGDIKVEDIPYSATASSYISGWEPYTVLDGNNSKAWSSSQHTQAASTEWVYVDTGASQNITGIRLQPRQGGLCFPVDFKLQYSNDGSSWTDVPGQSYTGYPNPGSSMQTFKFSSLVNARYIRLYATKLSLDDKKSYYCQIAELYADNVIQRTPTVSSCLSGWPESGIADNNNSSCWSSILHSSENGTEWVALDMGSAMNISSVSIVPRADDYCFPKDFRLEYSNDGINWTTIPGQSYTDYPAPYDKNQIQVFQFNSIVNARYIRMYATKLRPDNYSNYYLQLGEIYMYP